VQGVVLTIPPLGDVGEQVHRQQQPLEGDRDPRLRIAELD
jgi:hypothetical protein